MHVGDNVGENNINGFQVNHFENNGHSILPIFKWAQKIQIVLGIIGINRFCES